MSDDQSDHSDGEISDFGWRLLDSVKMADENKRSSLPRKIVGFEDEEKSGKLVFKLPECKTETVVVYLDRAEVSRSLKAKLKEGENEVLIKQLSSYVDKDSIRVEGRGPVTLTEVAFQTKHLSKDDETRTNEKRKEFKRQLDAALRRQIALSAKKHRLKKQRTVLDGFADNLMKPGVSTDKQESNALLDSSVLQGMVGFFELYDKQAARLDDSLHSLDLDIEELESEISALQKNLTEMNADRESPETRELLILLDAAQESEVELTISYVVSKAKWSPKYDIRVFSNDGQMKIQYYGLIQQATGEDWDDTKVCLSTAMPSIGGIVPDLGTQKLTIKQRPGQENSPKFVNKISGERFGTFRRRRRSEDVRMGGYGGRPATMAGGELEISDIKLMEYKIASHHLDAESLGAGSAEFEPLDVQNFQVKESITSTMYEIARRSSIPCDNVGHKVSVAIIDLKPNFEYESVPKKASHAYLKAKVKNTSAYALLAGPTNIFLDNNFIAKAELKAVSPQEDFTCSLGVDPSVRVVYKPLHKYREQSGIISKNSVVTYKQVIELKNTHQEAIKMHVTDQLPLSTDEKIKVALQEPVIKHPEKYDRNKPVRLNRLNNVEWDLDLGPNEGRELTLRYTIEYPLYEELETSVAHVTSNSSEA